MADEPLLIPQSAVITGWDFSTGAVKCLAFDLSGTVLAETRFPTDLWTVDGVSELNLLQLEGQTRASTRAIAAKLREQNRLGDWLAGGISATHHTAGRIDSNGNPLRRAICWNDQTLAPFHAEGLARMGGPERVRALIGGPWAERYSLSHLVKDEATLSDTAHRGTRWILPHAALAAGYLTGSFGTVSVSSAASMGLMDLRTNAWQPAMLEALARPECREWTAKALPAIVPGDEPLGPISENLSLDAGLPNRPLIAPGLDDQAAGLAGAGAVEPGHVAIVLGNSAVVNSCAASAPATDRLDALKVNWGPYLWMRCYSNGAQFLDAVAGPGADWAALEAAARAVPAGCDGVTVLPFVLSEPSLGVRTPTVRWSPAIDHPPGVRIRAAFEAIACLIALGFRAHEEAGQAVERVTVSGGIARSNLMCEILASMLNRPLERLTSDEGPALGAAVAALWAMENHLRRRAGQTRHYPISAAAQRLVRVRDRVPPNAAWSEAYARRLAAFERELSGLA